MLSKVKFLIIDELSTVPSNLCKDVNSRLGEIFMMVLEITICWSLSYDCSGFASALSSQPKLIFSQFSDKIRMRRSLGLRLWHLFKYSELTEVFKAKWKTVHQVF